VLPGGEKGGTVQGSNASSYEYNVAKALYKLDIPFVFQYEVINRRVRGGQVVDFLALTRPLATPIEVNGDYWHRNSDEEYRQTIEINNALRGQANELLIMWGKDSATYGDALSFLRAHLSI